MQAINTQKKKVSKGKKVKKCEQIRQNAAIRGAYPHTACSRVLPAGQTQS